MKPATFRELKGRGLQADSDDSVALHEARADPTPPQTHLVRLDQGQFALETVELFVVPAGLGLQGTQLTAGVLQQLVLLLNLNNKIKGLIIDVKIWALE